MAKISAKQWQKKLLGGDLLPFLNADVGLLGLRLFAGLSIALAHGMSKVPPSERFLEGVGAMGFPLPEVFAWAAGLSEFAGGLLIAAGLLVRPASAFLLFTMAVAGFIAHAQDPFQTKEMAFLYASISFALLCTGGGRYSVDALLLKKLK